MRVEGVRVFGVEGLGFRRVWNQGRSGGAGCVVECVMQLAMVQHAMGRFGERVRRAVVRIAATQDRDLRFLPGLERALVPLLSVASTVYRVGILVRRLLYRFRIFGRTRYFFICLPFPSCRL